MRRALLVTAVVLALLAVGGWVADNAVRSAAEDRAAAAVQARLALEQKPEVTLGGFPFSLAFLTRSVPGARAGAARVPLTVSGHTLHATGVRVETGTIRLVGEDVQAERVDATGVLGYRELSILAGVPVSWAGEGRVGLVYTATISNLPVNVGVTAVPVLDRKAGVIRLTRPELDPKAAPSVPVSASEVRRIAKDIPVQLPTGAELSGLTVSEGGLAVAVRIAEVTVPFR